MKKYIAALAVIFAFAAVEPAKGHFISQSQSEWLVVNAYQDRCGNGWTWVCDSRVAWLDSWQIGYHSYYVRYRWVESGTSDPSGRTCGVDVQTYHNTIHSERIGEFCSG